MCVKYIKKQRKHLHGFIGSSSMRFIMGLTRNIASSIFATLALRFTHKHTHIHMNVDKVICKCNAAIILFNFLLFGFCHQTCSTSASSYAIKITSPTRQHTNTHTTPPLRLLLTI